MWAAVRIADAVTPLTELTNVRQIPSEPFRRWFANADFD
jgi:hypothetical protein